MGKEKEEIMSNKLSSAMFFLKLTLKALANLATNLQQKNQYMFSILSMVANSRRL